MEIKLQKHFVITKELPKQSKQCRQSVLLDDAIKLWSPKWYIEIWATWGCRSLWCSGDLLTACTTELCTRSADLTALVSYKRLSKLLKFGGVALMWKWMLDLFCDLESGCILMYSTLFSWGSLERPLLPSTKGWMNNQRSCDKVLALPRLLVFFYGDGSLTHCPTPWHCSSSGLSPKAAPT